MTLEEAVGAHIQYNTTVHSLAYQNCIPPSTIYSSSQEPYCGKDIGDRTLGCTLDRGSVATCNLGRLKEEVPDDYRVSDSLFTVYSIKV